MNRNTVLILATAVVGAGYLFFQAGFFDKPPLEEATLDGDIYFFMAATTSKDVGGTVMKLLDGSKDAVSQVASPEQLAKPAQVYGSPTGSELLSGGLYIDDPMKDEDPRWGCGFAIQAESDHEATDLLIKVQAANTMEEPMRLVKIQGGVKLLRGRIPWRSMFTPMVAPYLHWERYYDIYRKNGYSSDNGRPDDHEGSVALEIYVTGPSDTFMYIDYIILMGDTSAIFDGLDPPESSTTKAVPVAPEKMEVEIDPVPVEIDPVVVEE
ncbi:MAG: hypothetical protein SGBAC_005042 [Bacillariaceae sp.]